MSPSSDTQDQDNGESGYFTGFDFLDGLREAFGSHEDDDYGNYPYGNYEIKLPTWSIIVLVAVVIGVSIGLYYLLKFIVVSVLQFNWASIYEFFSVWYGQIIGTGVVLAIGWAMYRLKCRRRAWYGTIEIGFATVVGWASLGKLYSSSHGQGGDGVMVAWISVFAGIYLVVRGLENLMEGLKVKKEDSGSMEVAKGQVKTT